MADPAPRVVNVNVVPAVGFQLEIEGADEFPFITEDDGREHLEGAVAYEVYKALNIPEDVPLTLNIKQE
ncbi:hypothetical protein [Kitasatospora acidiphila]|uniref:hypothetical protein n=1 Tax=Kitasatospora acidiphila TaxID=2567942 RepID=UPI003C75FC20